MTVPRLPNQRHHCHPIPRSPHRVLFISLLLMILALMVLLFEISGYVGTIEDGFHEVSLNYKQQGQGQGQLLTIPSPRKRLEFVHIPKTGGTSIEKAMAAKNGRWGLCQFISQAGSMKLSNKAISCPAGKVPYPLSTYQKQFPHFLHGCTLWHSPPWEFDILPDHMNPYFEADLFAVVRNPYDRLLSDYSYHASLLKFPTNTTHLNHWIIDHLKPRVAFEKFSWPIRMPDYCKLAGHLVPQYQFVYKNFVPPPLPLKPAKKLSIKQKQQNIVDHVLKQKRYIHHVLKFETLETELERLMQEYSLELYIPHVMKSKATFTTQDLWPPTKLLIQHVYAVDFQVFDYPKLLPSTTKKQQQPKDRHKTLKT